MSKHNNNILYRAILFFVIAVFISGASYSQLKSGYRFGINLTSMEIEKDGIDILTETPVGIHFGLVYEIPLWKLSLQSGLLFTSKGTDYKFDNSYYSIAPAYIEIPVHTIYFIGRKSFKVALYAGPYFSVAFGGYKIESDRYNDLTFGSTPENDLKILDWGFNFGSSLNYKSFFISFQYGLGLRNVSPKNETLMKNQVIGISIGRLYGEKSN